MPSIRYLQPTLEKLLELPDCRQLNQINPELHTEADKLTGYISVIEVCMDRPGPIHRPTATKYIRYATT